MFETLQCKVKMISTQLALSEGVEVSDSFVLKIGGLFSGFQTLLHRFLTCVHLFLTPLGLDSPII